MRLSRSETILSINELAQRGAPFLFLISFEGEDNLILTPEEAIQYGLYMEIPHFSNHHFEERRDDPIRLRKNPVDKVHYRNAFSHVIKEIHYGNSFLLNLTCPTPIETNYTLRDIFVCSRASYKLLLEGELVIFSPERFVRIKGNLISSNPMKGTINASIPGAFQKLNADRKEDAEHHTIVDLIRNDLSTIASQVRVRRFKYIEELRTHQGVLLQMSSEITGRLPGNFRNRLGEYLFSLLPAGSICGAPKLKTLQIIKKVERYDRGYYTGIFGYYDGRDLDSAVSIRFIEKQEKGMVFKSGGGITFLSDWRKEYEEMQDKVYVPIY